MRWTNATKVLQEILGVDVGDLRFQYEISSMLYEESYFVDGRVQATIEFCTIKRINLHSKIYGSLKIVLDSLQNGVYRYRALLLQGAETEKIAQAIADDLKVRIKNETFQKA